MFKGLWRIQTAGPQQALLCYALYVQPQKWLPVKLIQGRITNQVVANLSCVQSHAESIMAAKRDGSKQPQLNQ